MIALNGLHFAFLSVKGPDASCRGKCRSQCGNVRCLVPDSGLSNIGIIFFAELAAWCVDHQMNLAVLDMIHNVGTAFMKLEHIF